MASAICDQVTTFPYNMTAALRSFASVLPYNSSFAWKIYKIITIVVEGQQRLVNPFA